MTKTVRACVVARLIEEAEVKKADPPLCFGPFVPLLKAPLWKPVVLRIKKKVTFLFLRVAERLEWHHSTSPGSVVSCNNVRIPHWLCSVILFMSIDAASHSLCSSHNSAVSMLAGCLLLPLAVIDGTTCRVFWSLCGPREAGGHPVPVGMCVCVSVNRVCVWGDEGGGGRARMCLCKNCACVCARCVVSQVWQCSNDPG